MTTVIIVFVVAVVITNICWLMWLRNKKQEPSVVQKPEEPPVDEPKPDNPEPTTEPEPVQEPVSGPDKPSELVKPDIPDTPSEPEPEPETEPGPIEEQNPYDEFAKDFTELVDYFSPVVKIGDKVNSYLYDRCLALYEMFPDLLQKQNFPVPVDYWTDDVSICYIQKAEAWLFFMVLSELVPEKRNELCQMAYDYIEKGKEVPVYGWSFESDPNLWRMIAACVYSVTRDADMIPELRKEVGGKMLTYKNDISECYIDTTKFMPTAPPPFIKGYENRKESPVEDFATDDYIHTFVSHFYFLGTEIKDIRQETIQAIANKEAKSAHLFGAPRTVTDPKYGTMSFLPVFGKHNLGIEIPTDGAIAKFCEAVGKPSSNNRNSLLTQEYGRRRPCMGDTDASANPDPKQRALVNYAIEEGDGHTTGYYNKDGDYVDGNGNHIGDYVTYYQTYNYANSYPSGHSAYIMGYALALMEVIPDKADVILRAANGFAISRCITRYHWMSDTIQGRVIGTMMVPVLAATTNVDFDGLLKEAKEEYQRILSGDVTPEPTPTEKVNTSLAYAIGGYGSCHVDAGETAMTHCCTKQCLKERHPAIMVNQRVEFVIEGAGVTTDDGKTSGIWEANKAYGIKCPAVREDQIATITMYNEQGVRILKYRLSKDGTHDDGCNNY